MAPRKLNVRFLLCRLFDLFNIFFYSLDSDLICWLLLAIRLLLVVIE
jgi:hypothetical protein